MKLDKRILILLAAIVGLAACYAPPEDHEEAHEEAHGESARVVLTEEAYETAGIQVARATAGAWAPSIRVTGTLTYDERSMAVATARIGGRIIEVVADYGQRVPAGETLAWIDSPELGAAQADYLRAESMSRLRDAEYERAALLLEGEAISRGELLRREAERRAAEADLRTAEQKLHILGLSQSDVAQLSEGRNGEGHVYPVRSPIAGRVTERKAVPGRVVSADDELFTIARLESLWLFLQVFEKDLPAVREGASVMLTCESHPNHSFDGTVDFVGEVLDPHSRTVMARAVIENPERKLKPGMFVYASIETGGGGGEGEPRLAIPSAAVASLDGREIVFVQTGERSFEARPVLLGETGAERVEIRSGLAAGEVIVIEGVFTLKSELLKGGLEEHDH